MSKRTAQLVSVSNMDTAANKANHKLRVTLDQMATFDPMTENQRRFFQLYKQQTPATLLHGVAGTGKTFIAVYKALEEVLDRGNQFHQVIVVRSAVPSREIGHLPGDEQEKSEVYMAPYIDICERLFHNRSDAWQRLIEQKAVKFMITSFVRGITLDNSIIIVDECQNMTDMELNSIMTRIGTNSKIIFCGDFRQTDLYKKNDMSGLQKFMGITDMMPSFQSIEFEAADIVRSDIVKEYIIARMQYENSYK